MYKNGLALCFAAIAALAVFFSAILADARIFTALLRGLLAFLVGGLLSYLCFYGLERWQLAGIEEKEAVLSPETEGETERQESAESQAETAEEDGFQPLAADDLERLRVRED